MSELAVGSLKGLAANDFVIDVVAGSTLNVPPPAILQVVSATDTTNQTTSSSSFSDVTGMAVEITPLFASSKIIVVVNARFTLSSSGVNTNRGQAQIVKASDTTIIGSSAMQVGFLNMAGSANPSEKYNSLVLIAQDLPASTDPVTYKVRFRNIDSRVLRFDNASSAGQIYALEVAV